MLWKLSTKQENKTIGPLAGPQSNYVVKLCTLVVKISCWLMKSVPKCFDNSRGFRFRYANYFVYLFIKLFPIYLTGS
ncbi:hypothetical protein RIF29_41069 [Crotalaria pallida]|uniref:Uncharacterized protein n=1 Tax=Crotalaria pallida TaxID=3830 RepID=A0AAN9HR66_CROPI